MKLTALEIPEDDALLAGWLERQLVGCDLGDLIAGLISVRDADGSPTLDALVGDRLPTILQSGLTALAPDELRGLLDTPILLLELQERVLVEGGPYWDTVPRTDEHLAAAESVRQRVAEHIADGQPTVVPSTKASSRRVWVAYAIAASLLFGLGVWQLRPAAPTGWGFDRPGALTQKLSARGYLEMLAAAAGEWSSKKTTTDEELQTRLQQFRDGCETLLAADHPQLMQQDRAWLLARCSSWRAQIERLLTATESGQPIEKVRSDAGALADMIRDELLKKAEKVG